MNDEKELVIASGGDVFVAPVGTAIPADPTEEFDPAFIGLGLLSEDGIKFNRDVTVKGYGAFQFKNEVRRGVEKEELGASFSLEQWNPDNFKFAFGGGEVTEVDSGIYRYDFPSGDDALEERLLVIRWNDGGKNYQLAFERGNVTEGVEVNLKRSDMAMLPIGYKALASAGVDSIGVSLITDDAAFATAGS